MLTRYRMVRGVPASALPKGVRQDTRKHTKHPLRPTDAIVSAYLASPSDEAWRRFTKQYRCLLAERFANDRGAFDDLAELARTKDVYLGCNCPTQKNPNVHHCHTWLALEFFREHYPDLDVRFPPPASPPPSTTQSTE